MTFEKAQPDLRTPTSIGAIKITLIEIPNSLNADGELVTYRGADYHLEVRDQNGHLMSVPHDSGDLLPHLTPAQKTGLLQFIADLRTKAKTELLGP